MGDEEDEAELTTGMKPMRGQILNARRFRER